MASPLTRPLPFPGGFASGKVSVANLLTADSVKKGDKTYYRAEILTRTADGDEGGRHHLFDATVSNGKLYILNHQARGGKGRTTRTAPALGSCIRRRPHTCRAPAQVGDKRWFKGLEASAKTVAQSFTVA